VRFVTGKSFKFGSYLCIKTDIADEAGIEVLSAFSKTTDAKNYLCVT